MKKYFCKVFVCFSCLFTIITFGHWCANNTACGEFLVVETSAIINRVETPKVQKEIRKNEIQFCELLLSYIEEANANERNYPLDALEPVLEREIKLMQKIEFSHNIISPKLMAYEIRQMERSRDVEKSNSISKKDEEWLCRYNEEVKNKYDFYIDACVRLEDLVEMGI